MTEEEITDKVEIRKSVALALEPGDATHYEMVVVEMWDVYEVVVLNDGFFDKLTFLKHNKEFYKSHRGKHTNPWTIKAAKLALNIVLGGKP